VNGREGVAETSRPEVPASVPALPSVEEDAPIVRRFGWELPRAGGAERFCWAVVLACVLSVLALAAWIEPSPRGVGTHEQIPFFGGRLQPCGFLLATGYPCPSCGYTTTFAHAMHGHLLKAATNQPFGFLVFLVTCLTVPASALGAVGGVSFSRLSDAWPWKRIALAIILLWLAAWAYKIAVMKA